MIKENSIVFLFFFYALLPEHLGSKTLQSFFKKLLHSRVWLLGQLTEPGDTKWRHRARWNIGNKSPTTLSSHMT